MAENQGWHTHLRNIAAANKEYTLEQLSQLKRKNIIIECRRQIGKTFTVRRTAAAVLLLAITTVGAVGVHNSITKTDLFYKVYIDGKYIGTVKDPNFVHNKISEMENVFADISLVPVHQQINAGTTEAEVSFALNEAAHPTGSAIQILVDGREVIVVENEAAANEVIEKIKARFASADNTVKEVKINQQVDFRTVRVNRDEVRSVDSAVTVLLEGVEKPKKYLVSRGESLWTIASRNQVSVEKLKQVNPQLADENALQEGEEISISAVEPLVTVETVEEISRNVPFEPEVVYQDDASMNKGDEKVLTEGQAGEKQQLVQIRKQNGKAVAEIVLSEKVITEKTDKVVLRGTKVNPTTASGDWVWPVASHTISSQYGEWRGSRQHFALDISAPTGTAVYASNHGVVIYAGWDGEYGNVIRINHGNGVVTVYAHLSSVEVSVGQQVTKGNRIGGVGSTGQSTGAHLHYEAMVNGVKVNPTPYM